MRVLTAITRALRERNHAENPPLATSAAMVRILARVVSAFVASADRQHDKVPQEFFHFPGIKHYRRPGLVAVVLQ